MATSETADVDRRLAELDIDAISARFDFLWQHMPHCAVCGSEQIQLIDKKPPAEWKCRRCKVPFFHEPKRSSVG